MATVGSSRFGSTSGASKWSIKVRVQEHGIVRLTDEITGHFRGGAFQRALGQVNRKAAQEIQNAMARSLERSIAETGRHQRTTQYLLLALRDPEFSEVYANEFVVGKRSFLDRSKARLYWRKIEKGDRRTMTARILFSNELPAGRGGYSRPWSPGGVTMRRGKLINEPQPPGYKHAFMPTGRGPLVQGVGPWPAYRYTAAGIGAARRINFGDRYRRALAEIGIPMSAVKKAPLNR